MNKRIGEYPGDTRATVRSIQDPSRSRGPLRSPVISPEKNVTPNDDLIARLPDAIFRAFERLGVVEPHKIQSFVAPSGADVVLAAAAAPVVITTFSLPEQCDGFLTEFIINCNPIGSMNKVSWFLKINTGPHPQFSNVNFPSGVGSVRMPFKVGLSKAQTVSLWASSTAVVNVSAVLFGWGRFIPVNG